MGRHLRKAREAAELSSGEAAEKIRVAPMTLSRYENDHRLPDSTTLISMSKAYRCTLASLMTGIAPENKPRPIPVRGKILDRSRFDLDLKGEPKEFLPVLSEHPGAYAVRVIGPAMQPNYFDGDYLILDMPADEPSFLEISQTGAVRGRTVGNLLGVFRKP